MSRQRNANHELLFQFQLMTLLSAKFPFLLEETATDEGISLNSEMRLVRGSQLWWTLCYFLGNWNVSCYFVEVFWKGSSLEKRSSLLQLKAIVMNPLLKSLKKQVTCSICLDTYTEPKTISCLHTFCRECLERHARVSQRQGKFRCPECQQKSIYRMEFASTVCLTAFFTKVC